jgi:hypothetical protein
MAEPGGRNRPSHTGYLDDISIKGIRGTPDIVAVEYGIYQGNGCSRLLLLGE